MSEDFIKVALSKSPTKYHGVVPAIGAKKFFEQHGDKYVVFKGEAPAPKVEEPEVVEVTEAVEPKSIRRGPKSSDGWQE